jgi:cyclophilin family peptidyl-prolyl cis-trans isomerase
MKPLIACAAVVMALALAACGSGGGSKSTPTTAAGTPASQAAKSPSASAGSPAASTPAATAANGTPAVQSSAGACPPNAGTQTGGTATNKYSAAPAMTIDVNKKYFATIKMDIGDIKLELYPKDAPQTVNNFVFLSCDHYYDGVTFHRVIPGFVAQAGDPTGTGSGGPGYTIPDETNARKFLDGTIGMAKTNAPNSAGSQWFIDYAPQPNLDGGYTAFGQIVSGRDVLDKIAPRNPVPGAPPGTKINTIEITNE